MPHRRRLVLALALLPTVLATGTVHAQDATATGRIDRRAYESPQHFGVEVRLGPYTPNIDSEFGGDPELRPHRLTFGDKQRLMFQVGFEVQLFRRFGTLALGLMAGYFKESAKAFIDGADTPTRSSDPTSLLIAPFTASIIYRFDVLAERGFPVVPYGKAGLDWAIWRVTNGNGNTAQFGTDKAIGASRGWHVAGGIALQLDVFDPGAAREFDSTTGVNHTYVFAELAHYEYGGNSLRVGDTTWTAGLLFEF